MFVCDYNVCVKCVTLFVLPGVAVFLFYYYCMTDIAVGIMPLLIFTCFCAPVQQQRGPYDERSDVRCLLTVRPGSWSEVGVVPLDWMRVYVATSVFDGSTTALNNTNASSQFTQNLSPRSRASVGRFTKLFIFVRVHVR